MGVIEINGVSKSYGQLKALSDISLEVGQGEIFGLIGPDGAGKTTLFRIMTTLMLPDAGSGSICGLDIVRDYSRIRRIIGYMPGRFSLYQDLTVKENLDYFATLFGTTVSSSYGTIREIYSQIEPFRNRRAGKLSGGMKQKLALCCALVHKPAVLFLDEPTSGLDPLMQHRFAELVAEERGRGKTILLSSHLFEEIERLCGRAAILRAGRIVACEQMEEMQKSRSRIFHIVFHAEDAAEAFLRVFPAAQRQEKEIFLTVPQTDAERVLRLAVTYGVEDLTVRAQTLEELFLHYYDGGQA